MHTCQVCANSLESCLPGSSVHGILLQEYWNGLSFPPPGDLADPGIELESPAFQADFLPSEPPGKPIEASEDVPNADSKALTQ